MSADPDQLAFDGLEIFERTPDGEAAVAAPTPGIGRASLRLLALLDGRRCLADLPRFARAGELDRIVGELRDRGLVAFRGRASRLDGDAREAQALRDRELLAAAKRELRGVFRRELGSAGEIWEARVEDCVSVEVLRRVLREAIDALYFRGGDTAARRVVGLVKPLFRQTAD